MFSNSKVHSKKKIPCNNNDVDWGLPCSFAGIILSWISKVSLIEIEK